MRCTIDNCTGAPRHLLTVARCAGFYCDEHAAELRNLRRDGIDLRHVQRTRVGWRIAEDSA